MEKFKGFQVSVQVCVFVFDILMLDGEPLIKRSLRDRRAQIAAALPGMKPGFVQLAESIELSPEADPEVCFPCQLLHLAATSPLSTGAAEKLATLQ